MHWEPSTVPSQSPVKSSSGTNGVTPYMGDFSPENNALNRFFPIEGTNSKYHKNTIPREVFFIMKDDLPE